MKTDPFARFQGYTFFFREGFRWSAINGTRSTNDLKFCYKGKSVTDVQGMSLFCVDTQIDSKFITCIGNAPFISHYTELFINSTVIFQINDCKQIPIVIPTFKELKAFEKLFDKAYNIKKSQISDASHSLDKEQELDGIQNELDILIKKLYRI